VSVVERYEAAVQAFLERGGVLRMADALQAGINRRTLYSMRDEGVVEQLSRGTYRLASLPELAEPDLVTVATRIPNGVICLISALAFHELTTQIPHAVDVAVARGSEQPRLDYPPTNVYWFSGKAFTEGVQTIPTDGLQFKVYRPEKSIADAFKYRNKLGLDVALEALSTWRKRKGAKMERLLEYARICRVERVIRPYLEALT
jgi:predicted transcriptional regulator of viral defense system